MTSSINADSQTGECTFNVKNDNKPERNETFTVSLTPRNSVVRNQNTTSITILLNDDPYGYIGFLIPAQIIHVKEPVKDSTPLYLNLTRYGGLVNNVGVHWEVCLIVVISCCNAYNKSNKKNSLVASGILITLETFLLQRFILNHLRCLPYECLYFETISFES